MTYQPHPADHHITTRSCINRRGTTALSAWLGSSAVNDFVQDWLS